MLGQSHELEEIRPPIFMDLKLSDWLSEFAISGWRQRHDASTDSDDAEPQPAKPHDAPAHDDDAWW